MDHQGLVVGERSGKRPPVVPSRCRGGDCRIPDKKAVSSPETPGTIARPPKLPPRRSSLALAPYVPAPSTGGLRRGTSLSSADVAVHLLCSSTVWDRYGDRMRGAAPGIVPCFVDAGNDDGADVAWCSFDLWSSGTVRTFFQRAQADERLRWLHTSSAGVDLPVYARLVQRGVRLTNAHVTGDSIADVVLRSVLDVFQDARAWRRAQADHRWQRHQFREVAGSTWLVVGMGAIGAGVARRAQACGGRVIGVRRRARGDEPAEAVITPDELGATLGDADVVVLSVPSTPATDTLVDAAFLAAMKAGSVLVNVGRGTLVDEAALLAALDGGTPAAAILDVFRSEPLPEDSPWWDHPRVTVLPHNSAGGRHADARAADVFVANLARWSAGEPLEGEVGADVFA